jgi:hypothetical protein
MTVMLFIAGIGLGVWLEQREMRRRRNGWREYRPSTNSLRDYK